VAIRERFPRRWVVVSIAMWLIFDAFIMLTTSFGLIKEYRLMMQGAPVQAVVTKLERQNHGGCRFAYRVAGRGYETFGTRCPDPLQIGDTVHATFVRSDPQIATLGKPGHEFWGSAGFAIVAPTILAGLVGFARVAKTPHNQVSANPSHSGQRHVR
jgi:hypothetical protein